MTTHAFKHFDLPVKHLDRDFDYVPPKARVEAEIERRRGLPAGTLLAEMQQSGIQIAGRIIDFCVELDDSEFSAEVLSATTINTAWHLFAENARDVMRRRLYLPVYDRTVPITEQHLLERASAGMFGSLEEAEKLKRSIERRGCTTLRHKKELGIRLGNTALLLAAVTNASEIEMARGESALAQRITRQASLQALESSRNLYTAIGANPTLAQLADADSPLSVYWRRNAPNTSAEVLERAVSV